MTTKRAVMFECSFLKPNLIPERNSNANFALWSLTALESLSDQFHNCKSSVPALNRLRFRNFLIVKEDTALGERAHNI